MKKRRLLHHFLLLEVVASLGLFAFFAVGLLTPYAKSSSNLRRFQRELELKRSAQLAAMEFHTPSVFLRYLPSWSSSSSGALQGLIWDWPLSEESSQEIGVDRLLLEMSCDDQTPLRPRLETGNPAWRRLIVTRWLSPNGEKIWEHAFTVVSGESASSLRSP